jgi:hypothetical protein
LSTRLVVKLVVRWFPSFRTFGTLQCGILD